MPHSTQTPESWRPVVGYEGLYEVSNLGRVRRVAVRSGESIRVIAQSPRDDGRLQVGLWKNNNRKSHRVHQLVAAAFIGPCPDGKQVNHRDGDYTNNVDTNLEYLTCQENMQHALQTMGLFRGERHFRSLLTEAAVRDIRANCPDGRLATCAPFAEKYGVSVATVMGIVYEKQWKHVDGPSGRRRCRAKPAITKR